MGVVGQGHRWRRGKKKKKKREREKKNTTGTKHSRAFLRVGEERGLTIVFVITIVPRHFFGAIAKSEG